ncbi:cGMP-dependent protein kinase 1-like isoform X2 [Argonauta hians]
MGNGTSHNANLVIEGETLDANRIKSLIPELRKEIRQKETVIARYETELHDKMRELKEKSADVQRLREEVHKLRSVLQLKVCNEEGRPDILATIQENLPANKHSSDLRLKRQGVSGESYNHSAGLSAIDLKHHDKDFRSRQLIKDSILENDFLKNLDQNQVREIVDCMYEKKVKVGHFIIKEGESGQHLYVSAEGEFDVLKGKHVLGKMGAGRAFGELAILYNCTRTASVRAVSDVRIWVLDRRVFQAIMMKTGIQRRDENIQFLKSVALLKDLSHEKLAKIADVLEVDFFRAGEYIIREEAYGDTFFIINRGEVKVTQTLQGYNQPQEIRRLKRGDYFGEKALLSEDRRTANVIALGQGVECLTVDRNSFNQLIGDLNELREKDYGDEARGVQRSSSGHGSTTSQEQISPTRELPNKEFEDLRLDQMEVVATLGVGGFGRVELVQLSTDKNKTFALKCLKKKHIVDTRQQDHIYSEKKIMTESNSPFVVKMYRTFRDKKYIYMLMEACLGGELWSILRDKGQFDEGMSRFYIACVLEALGYLHRKHIIYRDLKPENLLLDRSGYIKLVDFGFAKHVEPGRKTWTFCGTPEYVAPEIILNKGHDHAVDYWGLGILMYELLNGTPPFSGHDPMKTYNIILKGIDIIEFPKRFSRNSILLIKKLCRESPSERLGYGKNGLSDIKKNKWFQGFDWDGLKKQTLVPPIIPKVKCPRDHSNFDQYSKDTDVPPDETSGWDLDF